MNRITYIDRSLVEVVELGSDTYKAIDAYKLEDDERIIFTGPCAEVKAIYKSMRRHQLKCDHKYHVNYLWSDVHWDQFYIPTSWKDEIIAIVFANDYRDSSSIGYNVMEYNLFSPHQTSALMHETIRQMIK